MAGFISGAIAKGTGAAGLANLFEYVNGDGTLRAWNCGQAAALTLLTHHGVFPAQETAARAIFKNLERFYPPDQLGGWFGSSRRRVIQICQAHGLKMREVRGEEALRQELSEGRPVLVMLGVSPRRLLGFEIPGGHWMVAFGFDDDAIFLSNWGEPMPWDEFRRRWCSPVAKFIQMSERGLTAKTRE